MSTVGNDINISSGLRRYELFLSKKTSRAVTNYYCFLPIRVLFRDWQIFFGGSASHLVNVYVIAVRRSWIRERGREREKAGGEWESVGQRRREWGRERVGEKGREREVLCFSTWVSSFLVS